MPVVFTIAAFVVSSVASSARRAPSPPGAALPMTVLSSRSDRRRSSRGRGRRVMAGERVTTESRERERGTSVGGTCLAKAKMGAPRHTQVDRMHRMH